MTYSEAKRLRVLKAMKGFSEDFLHGEKPARALAVRGAACYVQALVDTDQFDDAAVASGIVMQLIDLEKSGGLK